MVISYKDEYGKSINQLYQWDQNITLCIHGTEMTEKPEVQFATRDSETTYRVFGDFVTLDTAKDIISVVIPNDLLMDDKSILVYVVSHKTVSVDNSMESRLQTLFTTQLPVKSRKKPSEFYFQQYAQGIDIVDLKLNADRLIRDYGSLETSLNTLVASDPGKSVRTIASEEVEKSLNDNDFVDSQTVEQLRTYTDNTFVKKESGKSLTTNDYTTSEKNKLSNIDNNANNYSHPKYTEHVKGLYNITVDSSGHVVDAALVTKEDIVALGFNDLDSIYPVNSVYVKFDDANSTTPPFSFGTWKIIKQEGIATPTDLSDEITEDGAPLDPVSGQALFYWQRTS